MYNNFAHYYDGLTTNISYEKRALYFHQIIKTYFENASLLLDLACGTGELSTEFAKLDYDVTGVDISAEMLSVAIDKQYENDTNILYLCQDMTNLDLYGTMDVAVCALDSLNHITSDEKIQKIFKRLNLFITDNGLLIFDVNTPYKHKKILANNTFVYDMENVYCVWQNSLNENDDSIVNISLDFFEKNGDIYRRSSEEFKEKAYSIENLTKWLNNADFDVIKIYADDSFEDVNETSERMIFVAKRKKRI